MTHDEAIQALTDLKSIARCALTPDDVLVVECDQILSEPQIAYLKGVMGKVWPGQRVVVMDKGVTLRIVREVDRQERDDQPQGLEGTGV